MSDHADTEESHSIAATFSGCLTSYRRLYFLLTSRKAQGAEDIDLTEVSDNYGRLNVWGADSGALRTGRDSLDDIIRTNENLRSILLDILGDLKEAIGIAVLTFHENEGVSTNNDLTAEDYDQDSASSTSTASEQAGDGGSGTRLKETNAQFLISIIFGYIGSLYKLSKSLRRSTVHEKYIRSVSRYAGTSPFAHHDQAHVENKFPTASKVLVRRLGLANTRRRQQLKYWEEHHAIPGQDFSSACAEQSELISETTTGASESGQIPASSLGTPSKASHQSFTTVAQPYVCTFKDCLNAEKMYITRHEWLYHEKQLLRNHILHYHPGTFTESQLPALLDMCERAADPEEKDSCSLCGQEMNLIALRLHVASHLEDIALFALPSESDQYGTEADQKSDQYDTNADEKNDSPDNLNFHISPHLIPSDLSCLVLYEPLAPDYTKQPIRLGRWAPPNHRNAYLRDKDGARLFRWMGGRMTDITAPESGNGYTRTLYSVATVFTQWQDTNHLLAVTFDAEKMDVTEDNGGWKVLSFEHISQYGTQGTYSSVGVAGDQQQLAAPGSPAWMPQLLPTIYDYDYHPDPKLPLPVSAGLIGNLPLLFVLPAFSAQPHHLSYVLTNFMQPNRWHRHQLPHGHDQDRGMVVSVFLDPSNKEGSTKAILDALQDGHFGPFYA
ncbi:MAG: hypothetical protein Q9199_005044 [Rusavskia elegans]